MRRDFSEFSNGCTRILNLKAPGWASQSCSESCRDMADRCRPKEKRTQAQWFIFRCLPIQDTPLASGSAGGSPAASHLQNTGGPPALPTFIYDGDCSFCKLWVDRWKQLTGDRVVYESFQEAA